MLQNSWKRRLFSAWFTGAAVNGMLVTSSYTENIDTQEFRSDISGEVTGTGYTAGGIALGSPTVAQDNTNDRASFDSNDLVYSTVTITGATGVVLYSRLGGASSADPVIGHWSFGASVNATAANLTVAVNANGWLLAT